MELIPKERHFECIAGSDSTILQHWHWGCGIISWVSIMFPELIEELCDAYFRGDIEEARALQFRVQKVRTIFKACSYGFGVPVCRRTDRTAYGIPETADVTGDRGTEKLHQRRTDKTGHDLTKERK